MASIEINKFFKWGSYSGTKTVDQITTALGTIISHTPDSEGIGFLVSGDNNEIVGITAKDAKVNFKSLGGGTLGTAAATSGQDAHGPQITLTKNTGTDVIDLLTAQNSYLTVSTTDTGTIIFGTIQGVYDNTASTPAWTTSGLVNNTELEERLAVMATAEAVTIANATGANTVILSQGGTPVNNTLTFGVMSQTGYNLTQDLATANAINYGYDAATLRALGRGDAAVASVTANNGTVTVTTHTAGADSDTTNTFNVIQSATVDAAATSPIASNGAVDIKTTATTGTNYATGATAAYDGNSSAATYNPLATKAYVDAQSSTNVVTFGSTQPSSNAATMSVTQNSTSVGDVAFGVSNATAAQGTSYGLQLVGNAADTINYGLNADTMYALGLANTALQPVTAVTATDMFSTSTDADGDITVTAKSYAQATTAQSTVAAGTESFTVGNGKLGLVIDNTTLNTFGANATSDVTYDIVTTHTTVTGGGSRPNTPSATDAYQPTNTAANFNPLATQSYVDAKMGDLANALVYKGTVDTNHPLPSSGQKTGDVYVVAENGTYAEKACEVGDMLIWNGSTWDAVSGENQVTNNAAVLTAEISSASTPTQTTIATVDGTNITVGVKHYDVTPGENVTAPTASTAPASQNYVCGITMDDDGHVTATSYANPFAWEVITIN